MSVTAQKRPLPSKVVKMKARKRQKIAGVDGLVGAGKEAQSAAKKVTLDELAWNEVALPDKLEDYEGFFGLEEIDGVDVVRGGKEGEVSYKVSGNERNSQVAAEAAANEPSSVKGKRPERENVDLSNDEWSGIKEGSGDDNANPLSQETVKSTNQQAGKSKAKKENPGKGKTKPGEKSKRAQTDKGISNASFSLLEEVDGEGDTDVSAWNSLGLSAEISSALSRLSFRQPTPIQLSAIPPILGGHDLIGKAPTGSGKTLAFGIPIFEHWLSLRSSPQATQEPTQRQPIALIVLPTRELAHQITTHLTALCAHTGADSPSIVTLTGGLSIQKQRRLLSRADIIVATPGRLWEVIGEGHGVLAALKGIKFLVIDEADRLLSEGHFKELEEVLTALDRKVVDADGNEQVANETAPETERQTLVFSATFSKTLQQKLAKRSFQRSDILSNQASMEYLLQKLNFHESKPLFVDINPSSQMAAALREGIVECPGTEKDLYLYTLLLYHPTARTLVFANSISAVRRLVPFLTNLNLTAYPLHSQMAQKARLRSIERFSTPVPATTENGPGSPGATILVATDVAARGLDIPNVELVLHYHLPRTANTYVHRSGRTARGAAAGSSILLCAPSEAAGVRRLIAQVHSGSAGSGGSRKGGGKRAAGGLQTLDVDGRVVTRLRERAVLSKRLADAGGAKEKARKEEEWVNAAAEELGVDVEEVGALGDGGGWGRGKVRRERERVASGLSKAEVAGVRAELKRLLAKRVNVGVSERYLTGNLGVDVHGLLSGAARGEFLGSVPGLGFENA